MASICKALLLAISACGLSLAQAPSGTYSQPGTPIFGPSDTGVYVGPTSLGGILSPETLTSVIPTVPTSTPLVVGQEANVDYGLYLDFSHEQAPQPLRGANGGTFPPQSPDTSPYDRENSDLFAPPGTDSGSVPNGVWPMGLSHNRLGLGGSGWARQQTTNELPISKDMAGVDMRLSPFAYRELHWHGVSEWAFVFSGSVRVAVSDANGRSFIDDLEAGDVWFFPAGIPHSIQALEEGVEFLLVFDNGAFSEDDTALVSELFMRNPREVLAKNFRTDISSFSDIPMEELYIFPGTNPGNISSQNLTGPAGAALSPEQQYTYHWSKQDPVAVPGAGNFKVLDTQSFPIVTDFAAALVTVEPGAMRELHWHLDSDEWNFFLQGQARVTVFSPPSSARTFDYQAGDVGYIPLSDAHYVENTGDEDVIYLEILQAPQFTDISVAQWLGLTPKQVVKETLNLPDAVINNLPKYKPILIPGNKNLSTTNFTASF